MWIEYYKSKPSSKNDTCLVCPHEINDNELCIGCYGLPRGLIEQLFPFHPDKTNSKIINLGSIRLREQVQWESLEPIGADDLENGDLPPIGKNYIHLDCFSPAIHRPFQCMFEFKSVEREDTSMVAERIVAWQKLRNKLASPSKNKRKKKESDDDSSPSPKRRVTRSQKRKPIVDSSESEEESEEEPPKKRRGRKKKVDETPPPVLIKKEDNDLLVSVIDENDEKLIEEKPFESSCYLLGLSDEIWCEILEYLNFDEYFNIARVSRGMHYYSNLKVVWRDFICKYICPKAVQVQLDYFPQFEDNYKALFMKLYGNCCIVCGEYLRGGVDLDNPLSLAQSKGTVMVNDQPGYYNFLTDNCVCKECQSNTLVETINKTELKRYYNVSDDELSNMRCMKSPNPFHRSTAMFKYLTSQAKALHQRKQEKALLLQHSKFKKLKITKGAYFALIQRAKRGHFGTDCLVYLALSGDKSNYKQKKLETYISALILSNVN